MTALPAFSYKNKTNCALLERRMQKAFSLYYLQHVYTYYYQHINHLANIYIVLQ